MYPFQRGLRRVPPPVSVNAFRDYSLLKRTTIRLTDTDNTRHEIISPMVNGNHGLPDIVPHVMEFTGATSSVEYTSDIQRLRHLSMALIGPAQITYTTVYNEIPVGQPVDYDETVKNFVAKYCTADTRDQQLEYLRELVKASDMSVRLFRSMLLNCNMAEGYMTSYTTQGHNLGFKL